jgi:hypothetical protein
MGDTDDRFLLSTLQNEKIVAFFHGGQKQRLLLRAL